MIPWLLIEESTSFPERGFDGLFPRSHAIVVLLWKMIIHVLQTVQV